MSSDAQQLADQDPTGALRITGCDLFGVPVTASLSGSQFGLFAASALGGFWAAITPSTISTRVQAIEEMFQWYAIRKLQITYIPAVGSSTGGTAAFGYSTDWDLQTAIPTPTLQQALELNPAMMTPIWQQQSMLMSHTGTRLFETYLSSEPGENRVQGILTGTGLGLTNTTNYGNLQFEYVIDFYQPSPLLSSVDRERRRLRHSAILPSLKSLLHPSTLLGESKCERKSTDDDTDYNVAPPTFVAAPSSTPCGVKNINIVSSTPSSVSSAALAPVLSRPRPGFFS